jgi:hypothetical protein
VRTLTVSALSLLFAGACLAVVVHDTISYATPLKRISGSVIGFGNVNPNVKVEVFDRPEVWADDSLSPAEKRKRQKVIATTLTDNRGKFDFRGVPKGAYEVQFTTGDGGWNVLSILLKVDPAGSHDRLCVELSLEGAGQGPSSVKPCH